MLVTVIWTIDIWMNYHHLVDRQNVSKIQMTVVQMTVFNIWMLTFGRTVIWFLLTDPLFLVKNGHG